MKRLITYILTVALTISLVINFVFIKKLLIPKNKLSVYDGYKQAIDLLSKHSGLGKFVVTPDIQDIRVSRGSKTSNLSESLVYMQNAYNLYKLLEDAPFYLGVLYFLENKYNESQKYLEEYITHIHPRKESYYILLAIYDFGSDNFEKYEALADNVKHKPEQNEELINTVFMMYYLKEENYQKALQYCDKLIEIKPYDEKLRDIKNDLKLKIAGKKQ